MTSSKPSLDFEEHLHDIPVGLVVDAQRQLNHNSTSSDTTSHTVNTPSSAATSAKQPPSSYAAALSSGLSTQSGGATAAASTSANPPSSASAPQLLSLQPPRLQPPPLHPPSLQTNQNVHNGQVMPALIPLNGHASTKSGSTPFKRPRGRPRKIPGLDSRPAANPSDPTSNEYYTSLSQFDPLLVAPPLGTEGTKPRGRPRGRPRGSGRGKLSSRPKPSNGNGPGRPRGSVNKKRSRIPSDEDGAEDDDDDDQDGEGESDPEGDTRDRNAEALFRAALDPTQELPDDFDASGDRSFNAPTTKSGRKVLKPKTFAPPAVLGAPRRKKPMTSEPQSGTATGELPQEGQAQGQDPLDSLMCSVCDFGHSLGHNRLVICDACSKGWHQLCALPPIQDQVVNSDLPWLCKECDARVSQLGQLLDVNQGNTWSASPIFSNAQKRAWLETLPLHTLVGYILSIEQKYAPRLNSTSLEIWPSDLRDQLEKAGISLKVEQESEQKMVVDDPRHNVIESNGLPSHVIAPYASASSSNDFNMRATDQRVRSPVPLTTNLAASIPRSASAHDQSSRRSSLSATSATAPQRSPMIGGQHPFQPPQSHHQQHSHHHHQQQQQQQQQQHHLSYHQQPGGVSRHGQQSPVPPMQSTTPTPPLPPSTLSQQSLPGVARTVLPPINAQRPASSTSSSGLAIQHPQQSQHPPYYAHSQQQQHVPYPSSSSLSQHHTSAQHQQQPGLSPRLNEHQQHHHQQQQQYLAQQQVHHRSLPSHLQPQQQQQSPSYLPAYGYGNNHHSSSSSSSSSSNASATNNNQHHHQQQQNWGAAPPASATQASAPQNGANPDYYMMQQQHHQHHQHPSHWPPRSNSGSAY